MMLRDSDLPVFRHWCVLSALSRVRQLSVMNSRDVEYRYTLGEMNVWCCTLAKLYDVRVERIQALLTDAVDLTMEAGAEHVLQSLKDSWRPS